MKHLVFVRCIIYVAYIYIYMFLSLSLSLSVSLLRNIGKCICGVLILGHHDS